MRVFLTGGTGFIGGRVAELLRQRGDDVVALVRSEARATALLGLGCELIEGDLSDRIAIDRGTEGSDVVVHLAARFEIGIPKIEIPAMEDVNIGGVRRVLNSAIGAGAKKIVYGSTVNVFGNTNGQVVAESYERKGSAFYSAYDSTKYRAHQLALARLADGAPIVIVQPGTVYGPGDHFEIGREILLAAQGRLPLLMLADVGINMVYIDDVANGILQTIDAGKIGESYVLGGENVRLRDALVLAAKLAGRRPPSMTVPTALLKCVAPLSPFFMERLGYPPNLGELIRAADRVTYWASAKKAQDELGFSARSLDQGLRETLHAAHIATGPL